MANSPKTLIISGMHRSGTSMLANWLQACGLHLGEQLLPAHYSNKKGHFEDEEILAVHRQIMQRNGVHVFPKQGYKLTITEEDKTMLTRLLNTKWNGKAQVGFKDPRTCLFLSNLWAEVLPNSYSIFILRKPKKVIASLQKREEYMVHKQGLVKTLKWNIMRKKWLQRFEQAFCVYNENILAYCQENRGKSIVVELEDIEEQASLALSILNRWGFQLNNIPIQSIKDNTLLSTTTVKPITIPLKQHTIQLYETMQAFSNKSLQQ